MLMGPQVYSNGLSEVILGKAIKQHNLPREEIVVMTKVSSVALTSGWKAAAPVEEWKS